MQNTIITLRQFKQIGKSIKDLSVDEVLNPKKPYWIFISFTVFSTIALTKEFYSKTTIGAPKIPQEQIDITTYIPAGYTLVPLTLANQESIDPLIEEFGIVDLYRADQSTELKTKNLAKNLKIIRAPLNREQFAVLVSETSPDLIQELTQPVFAVIKNKNEKTTTPIATTKKKTINFKVTYGDVL